MQVGNYTQLKDFWGHVEDLDGPNPTYSSQISDGASDLGGQVGFSLLPLVFSSFPSGFLYAVI